MPRIREDDLNLLLPSVREAAEKALERLRALGYSPVVFDTLRTPEEALRNAQRGKGIVQSMHLYGSALDVICGEHLWNCREKKCKFFTKWRAAGEAEGLVRGPEADWPHLQAIPVAWQGQMRALGMGPESAEARDELCRKWLERKR